MKHIYLVLACLLIGSFNSPAYALDLFGVTLESSNRNQLRGAARAAGLTLIREGGEDKWFDLYDSSDALDGSRYCYLGFVKQSQQLAFVEYEFNGLNARSMLQRMRVRYGEPRVITGKYLSDKAYAWQRDGIDITLTTDWANFRTQLRYVHPENMARLRRERTEFLVAGAQAEAEGPPLY